MRQVKPRAPVIRREQRFQTSIGMTDEMRRQVSFICAARGITISEFARQALANEIRKHASVFPARTTVDGGTTE